MAIKDNISGMWSFNISGTNVIDDSQLNLNLLGFNNPIFTSDGVLNSGCIFTGTGSAYFRHPTGKLFPAYNEPYSFQVWIKPFEMNDDKWVISKSPSASINYQRYGLRIRGPAYGATSGTIDYVCHNSAGTESDANSTQRLILNVWTHLVGTYNGGSQMNLFVNGSLAGSAFITSYRNDGESPLYVGRAAYSSPFYFSGVMDEMAFWGRCLSSGEVLSLYNSGNGISFPWNIEQLSTKAYFLT